MQDCPPPEMSMRLPRPLPLPEPAELLRPLLWVAPPWLHEHALASIVNRLLRGQSIEVRLPELAGKRFGLRVDELSRVLSFEITAQGGLRRSTLPPDVTFHGSLEDFTALALRRADPDALFFQRRLAVEGETETGLHLKNLIDGWEYDVAAHLQAVLPAKLAPFTVALWQRLRTLPAPFRPVRRDSRRSSHPTGRYPAVQVRS